jgi:hypothetical protein
MATTKLSAPNTGHDVVVTLTVELIGVGLLAIIAGMSDGLGRIIVALMGGFLLIALITNTAVLTTLSGRL